MVFTSVKTKFQISLLKLKTFRFIMEIFKRFCVGVSFLALRKNPASSQWKGLFICWVIRLCDNCTYLFHPNFDFSLVCVPPNPPPSQHPFPLSNLKYNMGLESVSCGDQDNVKGLGLPCPWFTSEISTTLVPYFLKYIKLWSYFIENDYNTIKLEGRVLSHLIMAIVVIVIIYSRLFMYYYVLYTYM